MLIVEGLKMPELRRPLLLDLYCCAGGAAVGYHRAGFEVIGVDIEPRPHYPFEMWVMDALSLDYERLLMFDAIHASPPCQAYTSITSGARKRGKEYPDLYRQTKAMLEATGRPYIIENVPGSPAKGIGLCGTMFGLKVMRHRIFESNIKLELPSTRCSCHEHRIGEGFVTVAGDSSTKAQGLAALAIDWPMSKWECNQAIPPAYTEFLGQQLLTSLMSGPAINLVPMKQQRQFYIQAELPLYA